MSPSEEGPNSSSSSKKGSGSKKGSKSSRKASKGDNLREPDLWGKDSQGQREWDGQPTTGGKDKQDKNLTKNFPTTLTYGAEKSFEERGKRYQETEYLLWSNERLPNEDSNTQTHYSKSSDKSRCPCGGGCAAGGGCRDDATYTCSDSFC